MRCYTYRKYFNIDLNMYQNDFVQEAVHTLGLHRFYTPTTVTLLQKGKRILSVSVAFICHSVKK